MSVGASRSSMLLALRRPPAARVALIAMAVTLALCLIVSVRAGAMALTSRQVVGIILERLGIASPWPFDAQQAAVVWAIRLPRVTLAALIGATLATSGAAMQGLFRNPLADPALLGIASAASLGAVTAIIFGASLVGELSASAWLLPAMAFVGALLAAGIILRVGRIEGRTSTALMLLAGVAVNSLGAAGVGLALHVLNDAQLRSLIFWTLGSLSGASFRVIAVAGPLLLGSTIGLARSSRALNALLLGEREARHLGISVEGTQRLVVILVALGVGAAVAVAGVIGFVGLVVPHVVRTLFGPDHRRLLPGAALAGASLLALADAVARTVVAPSELPVGVITAAIGAPLFLAQLARSRADVLAR